MSLEKINNFKNELVELYEELKIYNNRFRELEIGERGIKKYFIDSELENLIEVINGELAKPLVKKINSKNIIKSVEELKEEIYGLIICGRLKLPLKNMTEEEEILSFQEEKEDIIRHVVKKINNVNVADMMKNHKNVTEFFHTLAFDYSDLIKCNKKLGIKEKNVKNSIESKMVHLVDKIKIIKEKFSDHEITVKEIKNSIQDLKDTIKNSYKI
jgi:hypothetical protein